MERIRQTSFLLVLTASFLMLLIYVTNPVIIRQNMNLAGFNRDVTVILGGDVMLGRSVMAKALSEKDPVYPFRGIGDFLREADITFVNLEAPFYQGCPVTYEGFKFCADPSLAEGLKFAGVDVVSLANNHARNYGDEGVKDSLETLESRGVEAVGLGELVVKKEKGVKFGFLGFDFTGKDIEESLDLVKRSKEAVDVLIVGVHWGTEYRKIPSEREREIAQKLLSSGADLIAGHGPHWVQGSERFDEGLVFYSLGNLVFDQMWSEETRKGLLVKLTYRDGKLISQEEVKTYMEDWAKPEILP